MIFAQFLIKIKWYRLFGGIVSFMRIIVAFILAVVLGGVLAASYSLNRPSLSSAQLQQVKTTCSECHTVPQYSTLGMMHSSHEELECSVCHTGGFQAPVDLISCQTCHLTPEYSDAAAIHNTHAGVDCSICHGAAANLSTATRAHATLRWAGVGIGVIGVFGLIVNFIVVRIRLKPGKK